MQAFDGTAFLAEETGEKALMQHYVYILTQQLKAAGAKWASE